MHLKPGYIHYKACITKVGISLDETFDQMQHGTVIPNKDIDHLHSWDLVKSLLDDNLVNEFSSKKIGIYLGTNVACTINNDQFGEQFVKKLFPYPKALKDFIEEELTLKVQKYLKLDSSSPRMTINNACTSSSDALGQAWLALNMNKCDLALVIGVDEVINHTLFGFQSMKLCTEGDHCKPFDVNRNGIKLQPGVSCVLMGLEKKSNCVLYSYGSGQDAFHPTGPDPEGKGLKNAIKMALRHNKMEYSDISLVHLHGTGTTHNDFTEGKVIAELFPGANYMASKGYTGHTLGAAGLLQAVLTWKCLEKEFLPICYGFEESDPEIVISMPKKCESFSQLGMSKNPLALSTNLGFGGQNSALILGTRS